MTAESICGLAPGSKGLRLKLPRDSSNDVCAPDIIMTLRTTLAEANYPANLSSTRALHASPSLPELYSSSSHSRVQRLKRNSPPMNPAALSSVDLQQHIYNSLLDSRTADVALHVRGTWEAIYKLHRVVLIQSVSLNPAIVYYLP